MDGKKNIYISKKENHSSYCTVKREGGFEKELASGNTWRPLIQLTYNHADKEERLRFCYYKNDRFIPRPFEIKEKDLPEVFKGALEAEIFNKETINKIKELFSNY